MPYMEKTLSHEEKRIECLNLLSDPDLVNPDRAYLASRISTPEDQVNKLSLCFAITGQRKDRRSQELIDRLYVFLMRRKSIIYSESV